ncbi:MAG: metallophosphoesterase family protein [Pyrinomonadaceae bacterium]
MRTIVHLSDLHFGRIDPSVIGPLTEAVWEIKPHVVTVSGDLTQRARSHEFIAAREFLDSLPQPQIVVPGNHDVPLYNVFARFVDKLDKYRDYISDDLRPFFVDEEIAVFGVNTARSWTIKGGRINEEQVAWLRDKLCELKDDVVKAIVSHHPFDLPEGRHERDLVGRARMAVENLARCGADLFLAGHLHVGHTGHTATRYKSSGYSALVVQAGTASSTRGRGEANSFNVVRLEHPGIVVERMVWQPEPAVFVLTSTESFRHTVDGWARVEDVSVSH